MLAGFAVISLVMWMLVVFASFDHRFALVMQALNGTFRPAQTAQRFIAFGFCQEMGQD
ncbi:MAG: hypothetical protein AAGA01_09505 [Cyanobacteria bacterium P01_E01_bin.43]